MRLICFLLLVTLLAVWVEEAFGEVGAFAPAFLLLLQNERMQPAAWSLIAWTFLQEGAGSLAFGGMFLFLSGVGMFFYAGSRLFERDNIFFAGSVLVLSVFWQRVVVWMMTGLQDISVASSSGVASGFFLQLAVYLFLFIIYSIGFNRFVPGK